MTKGGPNAGIPTRAVILTIVAKPILYDYVNKDGIEGKHLAKGKQFTKRCPGRKLVSDA